MARYSLNKIIQMAGRAKALAERSRRRKLENGGWWRVVETSLERKPRMRWVYVNCGTLARETTRRER